MELNSLAVLPDDLLCHIIAKTTLHDKIRLQLVSKKFRALLMMPPSGEGLWGQCDLSAVFSGFMVNGNDYWKYPQKFIEAGVRRWLVRRVPHMTRICCDTDTDEAAWVLCGLLPCSAPSSCCTARRASSPMLPCAASGRACQTASQS
ncbi:g12626 [Coccomyxa viridis]|uniref:G12626 protein n=1 Tax=Coccomyxa viridis TaxID=1274662 RepID=A0ABP1GDF3_9CHLO